MQVRIYALFITCMLLSHYFGSFVPRLVYVVAKLHISGASVYNNTEGMDGYENVVESAMVLGHITAQCIC